MELIGKLMDQIVALAGIASPLIGGKISADASNASAEIANQAVLRGQLIELLKDPDVLRAIRRVRPEKPAVDASTLPEVGAQP